MKSDGCAFMAGSIIYYMKFMIISLGENYECLFLGILRLVRGSYNLWNSKIFFFLSKNSIMYINIIILMSWKTIKKHAQIHRL